MPFSKFYFTIMRQKNTLLSIVLRRLTIQCLISIFFMMLWLSLDFFCWNICVRVLRKYPEILELLLDAAGVFLVSFVERLPGWNFDVIWRFFVIPTVILPLAKKWPFHSDFIAQIAIFSWSLIEKGPVIYSWVGQLWFQKCGTVSMFLNLIP